MSKVRLVGADVIISRLNDMSEQLEGKLGITALRAVAGDLRKQIRARLPETTLVKFRVEDRDFDRQHLRRSITIFKPRLLSQRGKRSGRRNLRGSAVAIQIRMGYRAQARFYGHVIEYGNSRIRPNPVWRQVAAENADRVPQMAADQMFIALEKHVRKYGASRG